MATNQIERTPTETEYIDLLSRDSLSKKVRARLTALAAALGLSDSQVAQDQNEMRHLRQLESELQPAVDDLADADAKYAAAIRARQEVEVKLTAARAVENAAGGRALHAKKPVNIGRAAIDNAKARMRIFKEKEKPLGWWEQQCRDNPPPPSSPAPFRPL